jgi:hypothetical protein
MKKRGFIRIADDEQLNNIEQFASDFRSQGFEVTDVSPVVGQITGTVQESDIPRIRSAAISLGMQFVLEDEDVEHHLPGPDAEVW